LEPNSHHVSNVKNAPAIDHKSVKPAGLANVSGVVINLWRKMLHPMFALIVYQERKIAKAIA
jgi:hypothetical protein